MALGLENEATAQPFKLSNRHNTMVLKIMVFVSDFLFVCSSCYVLNTFEELTGRLEIKLIGQWLEEERRERK